MALHFISDLHLDPAQPALSGLFLAYLAGPARDASDLYILGDLFEVWAGDDVSMPLYAREIAALKALSDSGTAIHFLSGNRDFLCGASFAKAAGLKRIPDPTCINDRVCVMHGDSLCTDDVGYQRFRRIVRWPWLQFLYGLLPRSAKLKIAGKIRGETKKRTRLKPEDILDVSSGAVNAFLNTRASCQLLIHGHTHRPADHELSDGRYRLVLADWSPEAGEYLSLEGDVWQRHPLR